MFKNLLKRKRQPAVSIHHCALSVSDVDRSIEFYNRVLGFEVDTRISTEDGSMDIVHLRNGSSYLELFGHRDCTPLPEYAKSNESDLPVIGTKHVAFVTVNPQACHRHLQEQGVEGLTEIFDNNPHYDYFFFRDPDGIPIEIVRHKSRPVAMA